MLYYMLLSHFTALYAAAIGIISGQGHLLCMIYGHGSSHLLHASCKEEEKKNKNFSTIEIFII